VRAVGGRALRAATAPSPLGASRVAAAGGESREVSMIRSSSLFRTWVWAGALLAFAGVGAPAASAGHAASNGPSHSVAKSLEMGLAMIADLDGGAPKLDTQAPETTSKAECMQKCFDKYTGNVGKCYKAFCSYLFGIVLLSCDEARLSHCQDQADDIYEHCKDGCKNLH
jgi:hypothetical protein